MSADEISDIANLNPGYQEANVGFTVEIGSLAILLSRWKIDASRFRLDSVCIIGHMMFPTLTSNAGEVY